MPTRIEWADETWSPITGCTKISEGCKHCWAERMARRLAGRFGYPEAPHQFDVTVHEDKLDQPWRWRKPRRVFVCSMGDLFHEAVPFAIIRDLFETMAWTRHHTYLVLTKRPKRALAWAQDYYYIRCVLPNVWLGVTAENQERADERIPTLLQIPAAGHFVSLEPLLSAVDLRHIHHNNTVEIDALTGDHGVNRPLAGRSEMKLSWVIAGGESGPGARPMHPDWVRSVRDQCQESGTPFCFKGWGAWLPFDHDPTAQDLDVSGHYIIERETKDEVWMWRRVGKRAAGRLLDGREWDEYPDHRGRKGNVTE